MSKLLVSIVTYNSEHYIARTLGALADQSKNDFSVIIVDNQSLDRTLSIAEDFKVRMQQQVSLQIDTLPVNMGFSAGHNRSVQIFLDNFQYEWILFLNPDLRLAPDALEVFFAHSKEEQIISPKLFRADEDLQPVEPFLIDAAGMVLTADLRHFDRGSNKPDYYAHEEKVFGGTGACLFMHRKAVEKLLLKGEVHDKDAHQVFPALTYEAEKRAPLFDEGFFAYREDADLCWRANILGIKTKFIPQIVGFHKRVVLPTNRKQVSPQLNGLSVANRFLLQLNNYFFCNSVKSLFYGILIRNFFVLAAVLFCEKTSIPYLKNAWKLFPRALERRKVLQSKVKTIPPVI